MQYTNDSPDPKKSGEKRAKTVGMYDRPKTADWPLPPMMLFILIALVLLSVIISYFIFFH